MAMYCLLKNRVDKCFHLANAQKVEEAIYYLAKFNFSQCIYISKHVVHCKTKQWNLLIKYYNEANFEAKIWNPRFELNVLCC